MAKRSRKNIDRVIAIIAGLVLAFGLVPVSASAAGEGPDGPGGQAPDISKTVAAAGPEASPAPTEETGDDAAGGGKAGDNAVKGDKIGGNGAQNGAETSGKESEGAGDAKADVPAGGADGGAPETVPADDGAAGGGKAEAPAEGAAEGAPGAAPADAGGAENQGGPAGQADKPGDPGQAGQVDNPGEAGGPEPTAPAAGDGEAAANAQAAQPTAQAGGVAAGAKAQFPAFRQSKTVGGVTVAVEAGAGAFPEGAGLSVASVPSSRTEAAVAPERDENENVAASYTFDIKVLGADGAELQPAGGGSVKVSFAAAEVADPNLETSVYHVSGGEAEELAVSESGTTATASSEGFSYYTVEFTYGELRYVLPGGESVPLADVLATVGLQGEPTDAASSNPDLFAVGRDGSGAWTVSARRAFSSAETLTVTVNGAEYAISVTDSQSGSCGNDVNWTLDDNGTLTISGWNIMADWNDESDTPWYNYLGRIKKVVIENGVKSIGDRAFFMCTSLESVTIPDSVTYIGERAFSNCTKLASVTIPDSVTSIGNWAFYSCSRLASVTIPSSVTSIGQYAFAQCTNLADVYYVGTKNRLDEIAATNWTLPLQPTMHYMFSVTTVASPAEGGTVEFSGNGMRYEGGMLFERDAASPSCTLTAKPKDGYYFASWTEAGPSPEGGPSAEGGEQGAGGETQASTANPWTFEVESDRELTANFEPAPAGKCTVTFEDWDGTVLQSVEVAKGKVPVYTGAAPTRPPDEWNTYTFDGWEPGVGPAAGDATYTAKYYESTREYTVTWLNYDGTELKVDNYLVYDDWPKYKGATPTRPPDGEFTYEFAGWEPEVVAVAETGDATYTAKFTATPVPVEAEYRASSGEGGIYVEGSGAPLAFTFVRTVDPEAAFAHFAGIEVDGKAVPQEDASGRTNWTARSGSVIVELQPSYLATLPAGAHTISALFDDGDPASAGFTVSAPAVHTVAFDANGHGKAPDAQEVEHGKKAKRPANPTADGYTFGGWYTDKACKEAYDFSKPVTEDVTLYAKWTRKSSSASGTSPKTGDPAGGVFAIALALAAASALALAASRRRSRG